MEYFPGTTECRIKAQWPEAHKKGVIHGTVMVDGHKWAVVTWNEQDKPALFMAAGLEVCGQIWADIP